MATMPVQADEGRRVVIQYSNAWPTAESSWLKINNYVPQGVTESLGNEIPSCTFAQYLGSVLPIGKKAYTGFLTASDAIADQAFIRVGVEASGGEIQVDPDSGPAVDDLGNAIKDSYKAIFYGRVCKRSFSATEDTGLIAAITAAGLPIILDQISPPTGLLSRVGATLAYDGFEFGPFNPGGIGNKSLELKILSLPDAITTFTISPFSFIKWTAADIARLLVNLVNARQDVPFEIDEATAGFLNYTDSWDFRGMNACQILSALANGRRGLSWRCEYLGDGTPRVRIVFISSLPGTDALTISKTSDDPGSDFVILPSATQQNLDLAPSIREANKVNHKVISCVLTQDSRATYDEIILVAEHRERTISVEINADGSGQMVKSWSAADETAYTNATNDSAKMTPALAHVWRTFKFKDTWDGADRNGLKIPNVLNTDNTVLYGNYGYNGTFSTSSFSTNGSGSTWSPLRMTGLIDGVDYTTITQAQFDALDAATRQQQPAPPMICLYDGTSYVPITGTTNDISVTIDKDTGTLLLGNNANDASIIKGWLEGGFRIVVTLAVKVPYPVKVSWKGTGSPARTIVLRTSLAESTIAPTTILGLDGNTPKTNANEIYAERCASSLRSLLGLAKIWYSVPDQTLTYKVQGLPEPWADAAAPRPGTIVNQATLPQGTFTLNAMVTRREWDFTGGTSCQITTARVMPSIESFL